MRPLKKIEKMIKNNHYQAGSEVYDKCFGRFMRAVDDHLRKNAEVNGADRNKVIKSGLFVKTAVAGVIVVGAMLAIVMLDKAVTPSYALTQTLDANSKIYNFFAENDPLKTGC